MAELKKIWTPSTEVSVLMQEAVRAAKAAAGLPLGTIDRVLVLTAIRDTLNEEITRLLRDDLENK